MVANNNPIIVHGFVSKLCTQIFQVKKLDGQIYFLDIGIKFSSYSNLHFVEAEYRSFEFVMRLLS